MRIAALLPLVLLASLQQQAALAAETLEYRMPEGFSYAFENVTESGSVMDVEADGLTMPLEQEVITRTAGSVSVLASEDGVPSRVRIRFAPDCGTRSTANGATQDMPFALAGRTIVVDVRDEAIVAVRDMDAGDLVLDEQTRRVVADIAIADESLLPGRPVAPGDSWVADMAREERSSTPVLDLEVVAFGEQGGRRIAELAAEGTLEGSQQGFAMAGRLRGPIVMDLESGMALSSRLTGAIDVDGTLNQGGTMVTMRGVQSITMTSSNRIGERDLATDAGPTRTPQAGSADDWVAFRHASGATLKHPGSWGVEDGPDGVRLIPPDTAGNEMIVASGLASGAGSPASQEVAAYLDSALGQMLPGLRRSGPPQPVPSGNGQGALYSYRGALLDGSPILADVYVTIENGVALSLSAIAPPPTLRARGPALREIFASMAMSGSSGPAMAAAGGGVGAGGSANTDDDRLIGMFGGESVHRGSGTYFNTQLVYVLNADGTVYHGAQGHFDAVTRDSNGYTRWSASGVTDGSVQGGRWSAQGGVLAIRWDSGERSSFAYGFEPDGSLVLRNPRTRELINFFGRVR
jgi:hypothetical protein